MMTTRTRAVTGLIVFLALLHGASLPVQTNPPIQYFYDDLGRLVKVVDTAGNVATYPYEAMGNLLSITRELVAVLVPVGPAWQRARRENAAAELYDRDGSHPTAVGSCLMACVLLAALVPQYGVGNLLSEVVGHPTDGSDLVDSWRTRQQELFRSWRAP